MAPEQGQPGQRLCAGAQYRSEPVRGRPRRRRHGVAVRRHTRPGRPTLQHERLCSRHPHPHGGPAAGAAVLSGAGGDLRGQRDGHRPRARSGARLPRTAGNRVGDDRQML